jgi:hypothetical protein
MSKLNVIFPENGTGKRLWTVHRVLTAANLFRVTLPCSRRGHAVQPLSWRAVLHLMWNTLYIIHCSTLSSAWRRHIDNYQSVQQSEGLWRSIVPLIGIEDVEPLFDFETLIRSRHLGGSTIDNTSPAGRKIVDVDDHSCIVYAAGHGSCC